VAGRAPRLGERGEARSAGDNEEAMAATQTGGETGFNLEQAGKILRRRAWWFALPAALGVVLGLGLAVGLPPEYESSTTILIEPQGIPEKLVETTVVPDKEARFHNIRLQILSRDSLSRIIDEFGLYSSLRVPREEVVERMRLDITIEPILPPIVDPRRPIEIDSFRIAYRGRSPEAVSAVANELAREFIRENLEVRAADAEDTSDFIQAELRARQAELTQVAQQITAYKEKHLGELPEQLESNRRAVDRLTQVLGQKRGELDVAQRQVALLGDQLRAQRVASSSAEDDPVRRKTMLELQLNNFRSRGYTDRHPDVIAARAEIAQLEQRIADQESEGGPHLVSPQEAQMLRELRNYQVGMNVLRGEIEGIGKEIAVYERRIENAPRRAAELGALEGTSENLTELIRTLELKRAEADIARSMELKQKGERFRVIESAVPPESPVNPNRPLVFVVATFLGLMLGTGLLVLREVADRGFYSVTDLQQAVGIPVLAAVPVIRLPGEIAARRARQLRWGLSCAAVLVVLLASGLLFYYVRADATAGLRDTPEAAAGQRGDV
jgi:polysaccharide chain length determinant protein (PEP-CTERM system associated)